MKHVVIIKEVWCRCLLVEADNCADAKRIVNEEEQSVGELGTQFAYALDSDQWDCMEAGSDEWHVFGTYCKHDRFSPVEEIKKDKL